MKSLPRGYFEDVYRANRDPWEFETSPYESAKYDATIAALPCERYRNAFDIGCSLGVLTERLAPRCDHLLAVDTVESALEAARRRCARFPQVRFQQMHVPQEFPNGPFDLVMLSEVGYYFDAPVLEELRDRICAALTMGGQVMLVHWTPFVHDYPLTGDQAHETFLAISRSDGPLRHLTGRREETYRLDLFERV